MSQVTVAGCSVKTTQRVLTESVTVLYAYTGRGLGERKEEI